MTVKPWSVAYRIGHQRGVIGGTVEFVPIAELRRQAAPGNPDDGSAAPLYAGVGNAVAALAAGGWFLRTRRHER